MTISSNVASLFDGSLLSRMQDALGNSGASATLTDGFIKVTRTPTGEGLKSRATALRAKATTVPTNKDSVSLSPRARTALANQEIGLKLILAARAGSDYKSIKSNSSAATSSSSQAQPTRAIADITESGKDAFTSISTTPPRLVKCLAWQGWTVRRRTPMPDTEDDALVLD